MAISSLFQTDIFREVRKVFWKPVISM